MKALGAQLIFSYWHLLLYIKMLNLITHFQLTSPYNLEITNLKTSPLPYKFLFLRLGMLSTWIWSLLVGGLMTNKKRRTEFKAHGSNTYICANKFSHDLLFQCIILINIQYYWNIKSYSKESVQYKIYLNIECYFISALNIIIIIKSWPVQKKYF